MKRAVTALLCCSLAASAVGAQEASPPQDLREARWYGWQVMLADAAFGTMLYFGVQGDNRGVAIAGAAGLFLAAPAIHLAHGSAPDAGKSLLFRTVPIAAGLGVYALMASHQDCAEGCSALLPLYAGLGLAGVGVVADWIFLSTDRPGPQLSLAPAVPMGHRRGQGLALTLRF